MCREKDCVSGRFTLTNADFMPDYLQISKAQTAKGEEIKSILPTDCWNH